MPRLPQIPQWSDRRRQTSYDTLRTQYQQRLIPFAGYRQRVLGLIARERTAQQNRARREEQREAEREAQKERNKQIGMIKRKVKSAIRREVHGTVSLQHLNNTMGLSAFVEYVSSLNEKIVLKIGDKFYTITENSRHRLLQMIISNQTVTELFEESGGQFAIQYRNLNGDIEFYKFVPVEANANENGGFFKHVHKTHFDLKMFGIYKKGEPQNHDDCCLINALSALGLPGDKLNAIKRYVKNRFIPQSMLGKICDEIGIKIHLKKPHDKDSTIKYGKEGDVYHIGLLDDHYFAVVQTQITRYCLENYEEVKNVDRCNEICGKNNKGNYKRDPTRYLDSFDVIKILLENRETLLSELTFSDRVIANSQFYKNVKEEVVDLTYDEKCVKPIEYKEPKEVKYTNVFFDFETYTNEDGEHVPYLVRIYNDRVNSAFYGADCGLQMLWSLKGNTRLIAHNANYDYRFLIQYLYQIEELARGNHLISLSGKFNKHNIIIKDSYLMISMALKKFPKTFKLESIKEVMPYALYNDTQISSRYVNIQHVLEKYIAVADRPQFLNNIKRWNLEKDGEYDIIAYSSKYCELDCKILYEGYNKFRQMMLEHTGLDIDNILTVASLSHRYFVKSGCYEGVNELSGAPQLFIQGCVVGGRTMTAENKKIVRHDKINDFDAVSLYPSAMARMPGFLKGTPKVLQDCSYEFLQQQDGYFVEIVIDSVGVNRKFPLMSNINDSGVRMFNNDMVGKTMRVDKTTLEDLIEFQKITFHVVRGYYFNEGFNTKIRDTIKFLFEKRLELKKVGNHAEMIYKLIMNSGYGKSIMKPVESETRFFDDDASAKTYITRHYNWINHFSKFGTKTKVVSMQVLAKHFNIAHVGVCILSMSKRIMNEVMCLAEDNGLDLYYQDTDSMHIKDADIATLSAKYADKYGRELIGKGMGQFHSDFELNGCRDIYAQRSVFLGKKAYCDELVGTDADGNEVVGYHARMKGVPDTCLQFTCNQNGYANLFEMYMDLYRGKKIEFDLTEKGDKANFKMNDTYGVKTLNEFKRVLSF